MTLQSLCQRWRSNEAGYLKQEGSAKAKADGQEVDAPRSLLLPNKTEQRADIRHLSTSLDCSLLSPSSIGAGKNSARSASTASRLASMVCC
mmetsp:Transcript_25582/g.60864  ORF Transcript_25582/g.60864 Transcript_25582/m.60864 type:complete len:91 (+) Transcript_25582:244-516(+)